MWEEGVDASNRLLRILSVHLVGSLAILFRNSEDAQRFERFERIGRRWVQRTTTNVEIVTQIEKREN